MSQYSRRTRGSIPSKPLPRVPGPKLAPFTPNARADIQFIKELGDPGSGKDGRVWKVRINRSGPHYALKMVHSHAKLNPVLPPVVLISMPVLLHNGRIYLKRLLLAKSATALQQLSSISTTSMPSAASAVSMVG